jgi:predicted RNA-binding protein with PIN domain
MSLIIDGYNLLHVTGIVGGGGPGSLQRCRESLLHFLAVSLDAEVCSQTTVVFDAAEAPPGLPRTVTYRGMTVRYASDYADADALIEKLIREDHAPRSLLVVSSDHRIQRAARRRRAAYEDSDVWYEKIWSERLARGRADASENPEKPVTPLTAAEIGYWVDRFTTEENARLRHEPPAEGEAPPEPGENPLHPFPPGFGEGIWDE